MTQVIERLFIPGGQYPLNYHDRRISFEAADKIAGQRLDRRKRFAVIRGEVCSLASWTEDCSGCRTDWEVDGNPQSLGCHECGYTGKRRQSMWIPLKYQGGDE